MKNWINKKLIALSVFLLVFPVAVLADLKPPDKVGKIASVESFITKLIDFIWPIFGGAAIIMFIVAGFLFLTAGGDPGKAGNAKKALIWGIIGVTIALLAKTIPFIIKNLLGV